MWVIATSNQGGLGLTSLLHIIAMIIAFKRKKISLRVIANYKLSSIAKIIAIKRNLLRLTEMSFVLNCKLLRFNVKNYCD